MSAVFVWAVLMAAFSPVVSLICVCELRDREATRLAAFREEQIVLRSRLLRLRIAALRARNGSHKK